MSVTIFAVDQRSITVGVLCYEFATYLFAAVSSFRLGYSIIFFVLVFKKG